jgi:hypothetical protein
VVEGRICLIGGVRGPHHALLLSTFLALPPSEGRRFILEIVEGIFLLVLIYFLSKLDFGEEAVIL